MLAAIDIIIKFGAAAGSITAIIALIIAVVKLLRRIYVFLHELSTNVEKLLKHDDAQYMTLLKLTITADHVPVSERLIAGKEYVERGGNGEIKKMYNELKRQCENAIEE